MDYALVLLFPPLNTPIRGAEVYHVMIVFGFKIITKFFVRILIDTKQILMRLEQMATREELDAGIASVKEAINKVGVDIGDVLNALEKKLTDAKVEVDYSTELGTLQDAAKSLEDMDVVIKGHNDVPPPSE